MKVYEKVVSTLYATPTSFVSTIKFVAMSCIAVLDENTQTLPLLLKNANDEFVE